MEQATTIFDTQTPIPKKRPIRKIIFLFLVVLSIFCLLAGGIIVFGYTLIPDSKNSKNQQAVLDNPIVAQMADKMPIPRITMVPISVIPTLPAQQTASASADIYQLAPTAIPTLVQEWRTYKNDSLRFSVNYPSSLQVSENSLGFGVWEISFSADAEHGDIYKILVYHKTIGRMIGLDFDTLKAVLVSSTQLISIEGGAPQRFTKIGNQPVGNHDSLQFLTTSDPPDPNTEAEIVVYIDLDGSTLILSTPERNKAILDHMISSFAFSS